MSDEVKYQIYVDLLEGEDFVEGEYPSWETAVQGADKILKSSGLRQVVKPNLVRFHPIHNIKVLTVSPVVKHEINPK